MVELDRPDVMLLQETLGVGEETKASLESWFGVWIFETLDVRGRSGGLASGWNARNVWGMDSVLGMSFKAMELVDIYNVVNIYDPYLDRIPFWEKLFNNSLMRGEVLIIGGDLNFSLGQAEV